MAAFRLLLALALLLGGIAAPHPSAAAGDLLVLCSGKTVRLGADGAPAGPVQADPCKPGCLGAAAALPPPEASALAAAARAPAPGLAAAAPAPRAAAAAHRARAPPRSA